MSRMVAKKPEYIIRLDQKWMVLSMMAKVYSTLPTFAIEEEKKEEAVKKGSIPKAKKSAGFFSHFTNPFEKSH